MGRRRTILNRSRHSSAAGKFPESRHLSDCNLAVPFASAADGIQSGNANSRSIAWKRGSLRTGSRRIRPLSFASLRHAVATLFPTTGALWRYRPTARNKWRSCAHRRRPISPYVSSSTPQPDWTRAVAVVRGPTWPPHKRSLPRRFKSRACLDTCLLMLPR